MAELSLVGHSWGAHTDIDSKRTIKALESGVLKRVEVRKGKAFVQNQWYVYIDVDAEQVDKVWVCRSKFTYYAKVCPCDLVICCSAYVDVHVFAH